MRRASLVVLISLLLPVGLLAQAAPAPAPAAAPRPAPAPVAVSGGKVAVIDFQRAITENGEGKKAQEKFVGEVTKRQTDFDRKQKSLADMQNKLQTQDKALSDAAKADLTRQIDQTQTELTRMNEDARKELDELQQTLFRPIAERAGKVLSAYAAEVGFAVVFDASAQGSNILYAHDTADITTEIIRRIDADVAKPAGKD